MGEGNPNPDTPSVAAQVGRTVRAHAAAALGGSPGPQAVAEAGLSSPHLELTAALRIALDTPNAAERWLAGEPVFRAAEQT